MQNKEKNKSSKLTLLKSFILFSSVLQISSSLFISLKMKNILSKLSITIVSFKFLFIKLGIIFS